MKHLNTGVAVLFAITMAGCNLFAAAESENKDVTIYEQKCARFNCTFIKVEEPNWYPYILAKPIPQEDWEKPDVEEAHQQEARKTLKALQSDPAHRMDALQYPVIFSDAYIKGKNFKL